jgi:PKD repeat protein
VPFAHGDVEASGRVSAAFGLLVALLAIAAVALSVSSAPAGAVVAKIGGHAYGLTPINGANAAPLPAVKRALKASGVSATGPVPYDKAGQLVSHGGPVMHSVTTHVIYWDPSGEFTPTTKAVVNKFFTDVAHDSGLAGNVFGIAGQYGDSSGGHALYNSTFGTEETDSTTYGPDGCTIPKELGIDESPFYEHCVTDAKLQSELSAYIAAHPPLPTGPTQQYFVLLPHNVVTCLPQEEVKPGVFIHPCSNNFYCAYHSVINGGTPSEIIYSDIPFSLLDSEFVKGCQSDGNEEVQLPNGDATGGDETTKFADVALKYMSHEYIEAATDPLGNAWWENSHGQEVGDKCNFAGSGAVPGGDPSAFMPTVGGDAELGTLFNQSINGDGFYLQSEWDNTAIACLMKPMPLTAAGFTAPSSGTAGSAVSFSGGATDPYAGLGFTWSFGDGATGTGFSPSHTYSAPGTYTVTMTPKDALTGSTAAPVQRNITVAAAVVPPPPPPPPAVPPPTGSTGSATGSTTTTTTTGTAAVVPNSSFSALKAVFNAKTGAITFTGSVSDPGTFSWLLTFQNGKFGVFAASTSKCRKGFVRLNGKCRPARIVFAKGSKLVVAAGAVSFMVKPTSSALKALKNALKRKKGLPVSATFTFRSSRGGGAVSHTQSLTVKLKK